MAEDSFSRRLGYTGPAGEITIREDAPDDLRFTVLDEATKAGLDPGDLRDVVCRVFRKRPDPNNWSPGNVQEEVEDLVYGADWFRVYDVIEAIVNRLLSSERRRYRDALNEFMIERGIGWQIDGVEVVARGSEAFESSVQLASAELAEAERVTARAEIGEALGDLSRRPAPDLRGAIHHAMGALECVARDVTGDEKATLGEILKHRPELLPKPLDAAVGQIWGYSSNYARHVSQMRTPDREEAELVVGLAAVVAAYLSRKAG